MAKLIFRRVCYWVENDNGWRRGCVDAAIYIVSNRGSVSIRIVSYDRAALRETHNDWTKLQLG